jgi:nicotinate phosphoribosyltransferase
VAKRGKWSGAKDVYRCRSCRTTAVVPAGKTPSSCACGKHAWEALLKPLVRGGRIARDLPPPRTIRDHVLDQLAAVPLETLRRQGLRQDF